MVVPFSRRASSFVPTSTRYSNASPSLPVKSPSHLVMSRLLRNRDRFQRLVLEDPVAAIHWIAMTEDFLDCHGV